MLTTLGTVIIFRIWTIRNEAPKYAMISILGNAQRLYRNGYEKSNQLQ